MTESEVKWEYCRAIDLIKRIKTEETHERYIDRHKAFDLAINALEKQIPKKVNLRHIRKYDGFDDGECPNCGMSVSRDCDGDDVFCPDCGQKLDWSEEE